MQVTSRTLAKQLAKLSWPLSPSTFMQVVKQQLADGVTIRCSAVFAECLLPLNLLIICRLSSSSWPMA